MKPQIEETQTIYFDEVVYKDDIDVLELSIVRRHHAEKTIHVTRLFITIRSREHLVPLS